MKNVFNIFLKTSMRFILCCFVFTACQTKVEAPIPEDKLIAVLADIHTSEGITESEIQKVRDSLNPIYYGQIFAKHGITSKDFDSTMSLYAHHPILFDSIYSKVLRKITIERDSLHKR